MKADRIDEVPERIRLKLIVQFEDGDEMIFERSSDNAVDAADIWEWWREFPLSADITEELSED